LHILQEFFVAIYMCESLFILYSVFQDCIPWASWVDHRRMKITGYEKAIDLMTCCLGGSDSLPCEINTGGV
jgi:hypothetical protein